MRLASTVVIPETPVHNGMDIGVGGTTMNRSFTARLVRNTPRRLRDYLWATHRLFNESLAYLLKHYFSVQNLTDPTTAEGYR